jgi:hypothetical protein
MAKHSWMDHNNNGNKKNEIADNFNIQNQLVAVAVAVAVMVIMAVVFNL